MGRFVGAALVGALVKVVVWGAGTGGGIAAGALVLGVLVLGALLLGALVLGALVVGVLVLGVFVGLLVGTRVVVVGRRVGGRVGGGSTQTLDAPGVPLSLPLPNRVTDTHQLEWSVVLAKLGSFCVLYEMDAPGVHGKVLPVLPPQSILKVQPWPEKVPVPYNKRPPDTCHVDGVSKTYETYGNPPLLVLTALLAITANVFGGTMTLVANVA
jgi:hypothetical protein